MLEFAGFDQGDGLRQGARHDAPHLLSVVQHGDRAAEMSLLWQLCSALHSTDTRMAVLDATATETDDNPGLQAMLDGANRPQPVGSGAWRVTPAATGMRSLAGQVMKEPQDTLNSLFNGFNTLVVYADADTLAETLRLGQSSTVVALSPEMPSLLSAYKSLKHMASFGPLRAVSIVTVNPPDSPVYLAQSIAKNLQKCTMNFLKCRVQHYGTSTQFDAEYPSDGVRRLVLNVLDNAASAINVPSPLPPQNPGTSAQFLWSH
jgi:hypothetical protein